MPGPCSSGLQSRCHRWPQEFPALQAAATAAARQTGATLVAVDNYYAYGAAGVLTEEQPLTGLTRKGHVRAAMYRQMMDANRAGELHAVVGRAGDFVGADVRMSVLGERVWPALLAGRRIDWFGNPELPRTFSHVPDIARALIRLGSDERAWHVPSLPPSTPRAILNRASSIAVVRMPRIRSTPVIALRLAGMFVPTAAEVLEMRYALDSPVILSNDDWNAVFPERASSVCEALSATIDWWSGTSSRSDKPNYGNI